MTERQEELIALHALGTLTPEEIRLIESEWRYDPRMREEFAELSEVAAELALLLPAEAPPAELRGRIMTKLRQHRREKMAPLLLPFRLVRSPWVAWAAAVAIAVWAAGLWTQRQQLDQRVTTLVLSESAAQGEVATARSEKEKLAVDLAASQKHATALLAEVDSLKKGFAVAKMEVSLLRSSLKRYEDGEVLVVWDQDKQEGVCKVARMPQVQTGKDYQLWVICKAQVDPVNAGVVKVDAKGAARVTFKCTRHVAEVSKFAVSLEKEGGVPKVEGPVILASTN